MILFKNAIDLHKWIDTKRKKSNTIGFIPTMGALHQGHISLITASKKSNQLTVSSIFVNPTQFNDKTDFEKYPITLENDIALLEMAGCDVLFLPSVSEIYPTGTAQRTTYILPARAKAVHMISAFSKRYWKENFAPAISRESAW
jgi:pantoate--beta-alanine ligase